MATEAFDTEALDGPRAERYSTVSRRSLIAMLASRALQRVNGSAGIFLLRPLVVMAAKALSPGPTRLRLVKLAHDLGDRDVAGPADIDLGQDETEAAESRERAA